MNEYLTELATRMKLTVDQAQHLYDAVREPLGEDMDEVATVLASMDRADALEQIEAFGYYVLTDPQDGSAPFLFNPDTGDRIDC